MSSTSGSAFVPSSLTVAPLTWTRPSSMSFSAARREAMPAAEMIFCNRTCIRPILFEMRLQHLRPRLVAGRCHVQAVFHEKLRYRRAVLADHHRPGIDIYAVAIGSAARTDQGVCLLHPVAQLPAQRRRLQSNDDDPRRRK